MLHLLLVNWLQGRRLLSGARGADGRRASAATGNSIRKIVVFQSGISAQVQQQVVARSGSRC